MPSQQYWAKEGKQWEFVSPAKVTNAFFASEEGKKQLEMLEGPHPEHPLMDFALPKNQ